MSEGFFVTNKGMELISAAALDETKVDIKKVRFGSGGDIEAERNYNITDVVSQLYEKNLDPSTDSYKINEANPKEVMISVIVPKEVTGVINEVGFFDDSNNLILYGIVRESNKPEGYKYQYECWIDFENNDESAVEIVVQTPEYKKVEELLEKAEKEFNLDNYVKIEDLGGVSLSELSQKVTDMDNEHKQILEALNQWV